MLYLSAPQELLGAGSGICEPQAMRRQLCTVAHCIQVSMAGSTPPHCFRTQEAATQFARSNVPEPLLSAQHLMTAASGLRCVPLIDRLVEDCVQHTIAASARTHARAFDPRPVQPHVSPSLEARAGVCAAAGMKTDHAGWQVQYIVGEWDFHDITLNVKPPVLIPRWRSPATLNMLISACCSQA